MKVIQIESKFVPQLEEPFHLNRQNQDKILTKSKDVLKYTGNFGIKSQINREPLNKEEMQKRKQVFEDFETSLAFDFFFGSENGADDKTRKHFRGVISHG